MILFYIFYAAFAAHDLYFLTIACGNCINRHVSFYDELKSHLYDLTAAEQNGKGRGECL